MLNRKNVWQPDTLLTALGLKEPLATNNNFLESIPVYPGGEAAGTMLSKNYLTMAGATQRRPSGKALHLEQAAQQTQRVRNAARLLA